MSSLPKTPADHWCHHSIIGQVVALMYALCSRFSLIKLLLRALYLSTLHGILHVASKVNKVYIRFTATCTELFANMFIVMYLWTWTVCAYCIIFVNAAGFCLSVCLDLGVSQNGERGKIEMINAGHEGRTNKWCFLLICWSAALARTRKSLKNLFLEKIIIPPRKSIPFNVIKRVQ